MQNAYSVFWHKANALSGELRKSSFFSQILTLSPVVKTNKWLESRNSAASHTPYLPYYIWTGQDLVTHNFSFLSSR